MKVGDLVREMHLTVGRDLTLRPREIGVIVSAANGALGWHLKSTRYWEILWTDGLQVMSDEDLEVINENR